MTLRTVTYDDSKFKIVPISPTNEMTSFLADVLDDPENDRSSWDLSENMYRAMIAAAPEYQEPVKDE